MSRLALAARLAARELRCHPWRTALAVTIMLIPIVTVQGVLLVADAHSSAQSVSEDIGRDGADLVSGPGEVAKFVVEHKMPAPIRSVKTFSVEDWLVVDSAGSTRRDAGSGDRVTPGEPGTSSTSGDRGASGEPGTSSTSGDPAEADEPVLVPVTVIGSVAGSPRVVLDSGRLPRNAGEVAVNARAASAADVATGDTVELARGDMRLRVTGVVAVRDRNDRAAMVAGPGAVDDARFTGLLGRDAADGVPGVPGSVGAVRELSWFAPGADAQQRFEKLMGWDIDTVGGTSATTVAAITAVAGGVVGIIAVVCSVAFTIGSRRRLRSLGMLATSGAAPADLGATVVLEGLWCGGIAAVVSVVVTYGWWFTIGRTGAVNRLIYAGLASPPHPNVPVFVIGIALVGLVIGMLAAAWPARTASRVPVLTALGGRRPLPKLKTRIPLAGLAVFVAGTVLVVRGVTVIQRGDDFNDALLVVAGLAVVFGGVAMAPAVVAAIGRLAGFVRGTTKLAWRSVSRDRTRYAAVVAAAAVALAVPVLALVVSQRHAHQRSLTAPRHAWVTIDGERSDLAAATRAVERILGPGAVALAWIDLGAPLEAAGGPGTAWSTAALVMTPSDAEKIFPGTPVAAHLTRGEAVVPTFPQAASDVSSPTRVWAPAGGYALPDAEDVYRDGVVPEVVTVSLGADAFSSFGVDAPFGGAALVPPAVLADAGAAEHAATRMLVYRDVPVSATEDAAVRDLYGHGPTLAEIRGTAGGAASGVSTDRFRAGTGSVSVFTNHPGPDHLRDLVLVAVAAATVVALAIVLVALALAAADGRDDDRLFAALGGPPGLIRRKRTIEAATSTFGAGVLAVLLGVVPTVAVLRSAPPEAVNVLATYPFRPPGYFDVPIPVWELLGLVVGVTIVVTAVVWAVQALGALRPRRDLTLTVD